jgi:hypothetical protein
MGGGPSDHGGVGFEVDVEGYTVSTRAANLGANSLQALVGQTRRRMDKDYSS